MYGVGHADCAGVCLNSLLCEDAAMALFSFVQSLPSTRSRCFLNQDNKCRGIGKSDNFLNHPFGVLNGHVPLLIIVYSLSTNLACLEKCSEKVLPSKWAKCGHCGLLLRSVSAGTLQGIQVI